MTRANQGATGAGFCSCNLHFRVRGGQSIVALRLEGTTPSALSLLGTPWKPLRARPEAHICGVELLVKGNGHSLRSSSSICTLQGTQRRIKVTPRLPNSRHVEVYGAFFIIVFRH